MNANKAVRLVSYLINLAYMVINMRKVESAMIDAIRSGKNFKRGNTIVEQLPKASSSPSAMHNPGTIARVFLYGNHIADYDAATGRLDIGDGGWCSNTTKSRLNALTFEFAKGWGVCQRDFAWKLVNIYKPHNQAGNEWKGASFVNGELLTSE